MVYLNTQPPYPAFRGFMFIHFGFQLVASHEHELQQLADKIDNDHQRQILSLRDKMAERKRRKMKDLRRKQEANITKESLVQKKELDEVKSQKAKEAEHEAMIEGVKENGTEDSDKVVRAVMAERHAKELADLDKEYAAEKKIMIDDALSQVSDKYDRLRDDMNKRHEAELAALQVEDSVSTSKFHYIDQLL